MHRFLSTAHNDSPSIPFPCSLYVRRRESSLSAVDMRKAEEQLRGASALMLELQRGLAEIQQPQTQPSQRVPAGAAPSTLPREHAFETRPDMSGMQPESGIGRHAAPPWNAGPETFDADQSGWAGGGRTPTWSNTVVDEWHGGGVVKVRMGAMGGAVKAGGAGVLRQGKVADMEYPTYEVAGRTMEIYNVDTGIPPANDSSSFPGSCAPLRIEVYRGMIFTSMNRTLSVYFDETGNTSRANTPSALAAFFQN